MPSLESRAYHPHFPEAQLSPSGQGWPHMPQLSGSLNVKVQTVPPSARRQLIALQEQVPLSSARRWGTRCRSRHNCCRR